MFEDDIKQIEEISKKLDKLQEQVQSIIDRIDKKIKENELQKFTN